MVGLPVARPAPPAVQALFPQTAAMLFLRRAERRFRPLGELEAQAARAVDDGCKASCVDWYGNARPISWASGPSPCSATNWWKGRSAARRFARCGA